MSEFGRLLGSLLEVDGIRSAVLVASDGFVIEGVSKNEQLDSEAVAAIVSSGLVATQAMGEELQIGPMAQAMLEYEEGIIVTSFLGSGTILAVVADLDTGLGNVRYQVKKRTPQIQKEL